MVAFWGISACNDAPGPLGSELIPTDSLSLTTITNDSLLLITSTAIGQNTPKMTTELGFTSTNAPFFIGAARVAEGEQFHAAALIRYQLPIQNDSIRRVDFMNMTESDIIDVRLFMRPSTMLIGDTIGRISPFRVFEIRRRWYNDEITRTQNLPDPQSLISQPTVASHAPTSVSFGGQVLFDAGTNLSRKRSLFITDKAMIVRWIKSDSTNWATNIFGLAYVPTLSTAESALSFEESTYIVVRFRRPQDTTENFLTISEDVQATITRSPVPNNRLSNEIIVQGGIALRTSLDFDIRTIPALSTIHQAELILPIDTVRSLISTRGLPQSIQLSFAESANRYALDTTIRIVATGILNTTTGTARYIFSSGTNTNPNMVSLIERLVKVGRQAPLLLHFTPQIVTNNGGAIQVFRSDEEQTLNRIVFRRLRESNDSAYRPRLTITYSLRPR